MKLLDVFGREIIGFFGVRSWIDMVSKHDYSPLLTWQGFTGAIGPLLPCLLLFEVIRALVHKNFKVREYKLIFATYVANRVLGTFITIWQLVPRPISVSPSERLTRVALPEASL